jgi:uncharacterized membrane protein YqhA
MSDNRMDGPATAGRWLEATLFASLWLMAPFYLGLVLVLAISAISLLRSFMQIGDAPIDEPALRWRVIVHLTFVTSGVLLALD